MKKNEKKMYFVIQKKVFFVLLIHKKLGNTFVQPCPSPTLALLLISWRLQTWLPWPSLWHAASTRGQSVLHDLPFCLMDSLVPNRSKIVNSTVLFGCYFDFVFQR
jgi:hypothetical protein